MQVGQKEVFITFRVEKSNYYRRDGPDIHTDANISLSQSVLGGAIRLQGIYEELTVNIAPGTGSHTRIRLNGKGLRKVNAYGYGDHYVHIKIQSPVRLNDKQRSLLLAYAELENDTPGTINGITYTKDGGKIATDLCGGRMKAIREALDDKSPFNEIKESRKSERIEDHDKSPSDDVAEDVAEEVKGTSACQNKV